jgi:hypothetical protein
MAHTFLNEVVLTHIIEKEVLREFTQLGIDYWNKNKEERFIAFDR